MLEILFEGYPVLRLLLPLVTVGIAGPAAFGCWIARAILRCPGGEGPDPRRLARELIPLLASAAALTAGILTTPPPPPGGVLMAEGTVRDGPWPKSGSPGSHAIVLEPARPGGGATLWVTVDGPIESWLVTGTPVRFPAHHSGSGPWLRTRGALIEKGEGGPSVPARAAFRLRDTLRRRLNDSLSRRNATLAGALTLGITTSLSRRVRDTFRRTGTAHLLAISGLHVGFLVLLLGKLLEGAGCSRRRGLPVQAAALIVFVLLTGGRPPVLRAALVGAHYLLASRLRRRRDPLDGLFGALLILAIWRPAMFVELSFQLSLAGYGAILVYLRFRRAVARIIGLRLTGQAPCPTEKKPWWAIARVIRSRIGHLVARILDLIGVSLAAWLGTLPLVIHVFGTFAPLSPLVNAAVFPLFGMALITCFIHTSAALAGLHASVLTAWPAERSLDLFYFTLTRLEVLLPDPVRTAPLSGFSTAAIYGISVFLGLAILARSLRKGRGRIRGITEFPCKSGGYRDDKL